MNRNYFCPPVILLLAVLIVSTVGCAKPPEQPVPTINSFSASPVEINPGQWMTLEWSTSGAENIIIKPEINDVGPTGSLKLSPSENITYVLTASNEAGSTIASVVVTVIPVYAGKPDLVITDIFCVGCMLYYKIKNQGDAASKPFTAHFGVSRVDYIDLLAPGEEITSTIPNLVMGGQHCYCAGIFTICADPDNEVEESNENNNCLTQEAH